jgi:hypothetical protein
MRALLFIILAGLFFMTFNASANDYYVETVKVGRDLKPATVQEFNRILKTEAGKVLPGSLVQSRKAADTLIKPSLIQTELGTKLVIERYDMGELFSTIEVPELESVGQAEWNRICARALRDLIYGNFRQPTLTETTKAVATR